MTISKLEKTARTLAKTEICILRFAQAPPASKTGKSFNKIVVRDNREEDSVINQVKEDLFSATREERRKKLQALKELAVSYNKMWGEARGLEDELQE